MAFNITIDIYELLNNIIFLILIITVKYILFNSNNVKDDNIKENSITGKNYNIDEYIEGMRV